MTIGAYELFEVQSDDVTVDLLVFKFYRCFAPGMIEAMLDANPQLSLVHRTTPFIPVGTYVRIPVDLNILAGRPPKINPWS